MVEVNGTQVGAHRWRYGSHANRIEARVEDRTEAALKIALAEDAQ